MRKRRYFYEVGWDTRIWILFPTIQLSLLTRYIELSIGWLCYRFTIARYK
jgi:hypothetical protein